VLPHHHHHPPLHQHINADAAIISGSDINLSQNNDSSSQHSTSSLEDRPQDGDGHTDDMDGCRSGMCDDADKSDDDDSDGMTRKYEIPPEDVLYNPNLDEEDEAWVYKHKRGMQENEDCRNIKATDALQLQHGQKQSSSLPKIFKPRTSDAVLSCPCCFEIVCMDCQRHERYANQFRAMFVMNIGVSWDVTICPEHMGGKNIDKDNHDSLDTNRTMMAKNSTFGHCNDNGHGSSSNANATSYKLPVVEDSQAAAYGVATSSGNEETYFSVYCNKCCTVVAGLNMQDEVYHFFGCLASG